MIILPVKCNTYLEKGGHKMNEVFERLSDVFEELRSDAGEREYSIQTEEAKKADKELKKKTGNMKNSYLTFLQSREIF